MNSKGGIGEHLRSLTTGLVVICAMLVLAGSFLPSPALPEAKLAPAEPVRLIIPSLQMRAPIVPIEVEPSGTLYPPDDVDTVGWWERSAMPGADVGQTLITGHTVHNGDGVMNNLGDLEVGEAVKVRTPEGTQHYEATEVFVYTREELSKNAQVLFGQDRDPLRLVLITCTDWKDGVYQKNIIAFADPVDVDVADDGKQVTEAAAG